MAGRGEVGKMTKDGEEGRWEVGRGEVGRGEGGKGEGGGEE